MSLIDQTYFINNLSVDIGTYSNIDSSIEKYEAVFLNELLGYEDASAIEDISSGPSRLNDIKEGVEYEDSNGDLQKWKGLINDSKLSPIACYVYIHYVRNKVTSMQGVGMVNAKQENSSIADAGFKLQQAQMEMQGYIKELNDMLTNKWPDFDLCYIDENINMFDL